MRTQTVMLALEYAVALVIFATACSVNEHPSIEQINQSLPTMQIGNNQHGELSLNFGGALSKELKRDLKYHALKVNLVAGTASVSVRLGKDMAADEFVVGIESTQGKAILQLLNAEQPWRWEGLKAVPFANVLNFSGSIGDRTWKYVSVYPDPKLESLLGRLRTVVGRR